MKNLVLISDDKDFFDYITAFFKPKEIHNIKTVTFEEVTEQFHLIKNSILVINSENSKEKTIDLLRIFKYSPIIVVAYNYDEDYKTKCYENGAFDYITLLEAETELKLKIISASRWQELLTKNNLYNNLLVKKNIVTKNNEIYIDYNDLLDITLQEIKKSKKSAVFMAMSPDEKSKYLINQSQLETIILNNIKPSDLVLNYGANKYFVLMFDIDITSAQNFWTQLLKKLPQKIYSEFCVVRSQTREILINEVLNKLHQTINLNKFGKENVIQTKTIEPISLSSANTNFKNYKQQFIKNFDRIVTPIFYQYQQKYTSVLNGFNIQQSVSNGSGYFNIQGKNTINSIQISSPGCSRINIDIIFKKNSKIIDSKRITLEPSEVEEGILSDIMEQYFIENRDRILSKV